MDINGSGVHFGDFVFDRTRGELIKNGTVIDLNVQEIIDWAGQHSLDVRKAVL